MNCKGFRNAVNCMHFGVCQYGHIAVTKVQCFHQFLKQINDSRTVDSMELLTSIHSLGVPFPPFNWLAGYCHSSTMGHFFLSTFEWSWHKYLTQAGPIFFPWEFWQSWWGRKKKEQRRQKKKIHLSFFGPLPSAV